MLVRSVSTFQVRDRGHEIGRQTSRRSGAPYKMTYSASNLERFSSASTDKPSHRTRSAAITGSETPFTSSIFGADPKRRRQASRRGLRAAVVCVARAEGEGIKIAKIAMERKGGQHTPERAVPGERYKVHKTTGGENALDKTEILVVPSLCAAGMEHPYPLSGLTRMRWKRWTRECERGHAMYE